MSIRSNVNARNLDQRIRIEQRIETQDALGDPIASWVERVTCFARVDATMVKNAEPVYADEKRQSTDTTFWIRADVVDRFGVVLTDRVVWKNRPYDIRDMPDQQLRGRLAALIATAGINEG